MSFLKWLTGLFPKKSYQVSEIVNISRVGKKWMGLRYTTVEYYEITVTTRYWWPWRQSEVRRFWSMEGVGHLIKQPPVGVSLLISGPLEVALNAMDLRIDDAVMKLRSPPAKSRQIEQWFKA